MKRSVPETAQTPITAATRYCAVYGQPIRHSASPPMQNAGFSALGLDWRYLAFEVPPAELSAAITGAKAMRFLGLNLTVPHKLLAVDLVDLLDDSAKEWGTVNTIRFEGHDGAGVLRPLAELSDGSAGPILARGFNTDAEAIVRSIREDLDLPLSGVRVLLLGAGGAGRTAALKLASAGVKSLHLVNRTPARAVEVAEAVTRRFPRVPVEVGYPTGPVELVLNATSVGLATGDGLPFDERQFSLSRAGAAYDMVYRQAETPFLRSARLAGCRVANGLGMLLYQGARALEIWSGREAPVAVMRDALKQAIYGGRSGPAYDGRLQLPGLASQPPAEPGVAS